MLPRLIGITGRAGSGKDTLADYLVRTFRYTKYSLAKPLKDLLNARFGWDENHWLNREWKEQPQQQCGYSASEGFDSQLFSPRSWAQWLGTEVGRTIGGEDVWVNMMEREWKRLERAQRDAGGPPPRMVVPDVRFDNEARRIHLLGGCVIRVLRDDCVAVPNHASERGVSDSLVNVQVSNNADISTFVTEAVHALEKCPSGGDTGPLENGDL